MEVRIYYEDTDCGGVVYYANYLRYLERAENNYIEERGLSVAGLMNEGTVFVVVHAEVDYRSPARYGDTLGDRHGHLRYKPRLIHVRACCEGEGQRASGRR